MGCKELACGSAIKDWKFLDVLENYEIIKKFNSLEMLLLLLVLLLLLLLLSATVPHYLVKVV